MPPVEMITFEHIKKKPVLHAVLAVPCIVSLTVLSVPDLLNSKNGKLREARVNPVSQVFVYIPITEEASLPCSFLLTYVNFGLVCLIRSFTVY